MLVNGQQWWFRLARIKGQALFSPTLLEWFDYLAERDCHVAIKRNIVRLLQFQEIPEENQSKLFDHCMQFIRSPEEPIAIKAFSMGIVANLFRHFPELSQEAIICIEDLLSLDVSPGIKARGKGVLKKLYVLNDSLLTDEGI